MNDPSTPTIFALASGPPPAAIALIRISGPQACSALQALAGRVPPPRRATAAALRDPATGELLDRALVLWLPGPASATGEDTAELHLHGGRAVIAAVERALLAIDRMRRAQPGEFTRRSFVNGRLDLAEAEGLTDLLSAETELQRRTAMAMATGALSRQTDTWRMRVLDLAAGVEALLDFSDEDDVADLPGSFAAQCQDVAREIEGWLKRPRAELLRDGFAVVLAGPPNSGKSTLFNALTQSESAIVSPHAGTTRDLISRTVSLDGVPVRFVDTAGLREGGHDPIEQVGIERARAAAASADLVLWLGNTGDGPPHAVVIEVAAQQDMPGATPKSEPSCAVSATTGEGLTKLRDAILRHARESLPLPGEVALVARQRDLLGDCAHHLQLAGACSDLVLVAEHLRLARLALDRLVGRSGTEDMLDALFSRFCIGK